MMTNLKAIDSPSFENQFGWEKIGTDDFAIPVLVRSNGIRYSPVKIVEQEIIKKYDCLPPGIFQCITIKSFYMTACEAKLMNDINFNHCNNKYGEAFFCTKDIIISAADIKELSRYLNISSEIFNRDLTRVVSNFGVIKLIVDPLSPNDTMLVPYIAKTYLEKTVRFVPSKLVEPFVTKSSTSVRGSPSEWDILYLRMLCIYCENNLQQFISRDCQIILLDGLMYSKTGAPIVYEDYNGRPKGNSNG